MLFGPGGLPRSLPSRAVLQFARNSPFCLSSIKMRGTDMQELSLRCQTRPTAHVATGVRTKPRTHPHKLLQSTRCNPQQFLQPARATTAQNLRAPMKRSPGLIFLPHIAASKNPPFFKSHFFKELLLSSGHHNYLAYILCCLYCLYSILLILLCQ